MAALHTRLDRFVGLIGQGCMLIAVLLFATGLGLLTSDIALRYLLNRPMAYVSEIVTIGFLYVYMLGAAALYVRNEDIVLDFIYLRFGMRVRAVWLLVIHLAIAATMLVALDATLQMIALQRHVPTPLLRIPLVTQHYAFVAAAAIIMLSSLVNALGCLVALRAGHDPLHHRAATAS